MKHAHSIYLSRSDAREGDTPIYETIINYLSSGYAVIYAAESNQSQVISRIKEVVAAKVKDNNNNLNIESLLQNGTFTIFDSESIYSFEKTKLEPQRLLNFWYSIIREKLGKENSNLKGILAIGTAKVFLDTGNLENLLIYEDMIGKTFDMPFEGICYYDLQSISQLSLQNIISLLNMHQSTIHRGWQYKEWSQEDIIRLISAGLDNILGGGAVQNSSCNFGNHLQNRYQYNCDSACIIRSSN